MMSVVRLSLLSLLFLAVAPPVRSQQDAKSLAGRARAVLKQHCARCHNGPGSESGFEFDVLKDGTLKAQVGDEKPVVVAGKPDESRVFVRTATDRTMPPRSVKARPTDEEVAVLKSWIEAGAPPFPDVIGRRFIPLVEVLTAVRDQLRNADREDRPYLRYFTLTNLYNNPSVPDADLRVYRAALAKALNSLSWKPGLVLPEAVDKEQTVFVIDVRRLDWDRHDLWQSVMRCYPYGLKYTNHPEDRLRKLDEDVTDLTRCELPLIRADWFVSTATRPPLYHTLLQIPVNVKSLEERLSVDVVANFHEGKLMRAGFARSGVSGQNRLVERHDAAHGAYWKSYDFKPDAGRAKLMRFPLGPLNLYPTGKHPYPNQAFIHDGGEIIFNLPNGLQGYALTDGKDNRIDEGPIQVVSDGLKTSGTPAIVNGVSCMACHKHGTIPFTDTIRAGSAVFGRAEEKIKQLYPEPKKFRELVEADQRRFLGALERVIGPPLRVGADKDKPLQDFPEPVGEVSRSYRLGYLDLRTAACELDVEKPAELLRKVGEKRFKQLGLDALLKPDGVVGRLEWEAVDGVSLMQEVARELRATPVGGP